MGRGMRFAVFGAAVVGSVGGGLAAMVSPSGSSTAGSTTPRPASPAVAQPGPASGGSAIVPATAPGTAVSPPPDPRVVIATQMKTLLTRFAAWSRDHAGAPCPESAALGVALDPWGHPIALTCTDQPADQKVGAISAGADGVAGNDDDVASWTLGRGVTDLVRGGRWKSTRPPATQPPIARHIKQSTSAQTPPPATTTTRPAAPTPAPATSTRAPATPTTKPTAAPLDAGADDIPSHR
jgi:hypothetical protein